MAADISTDAVFSAIRNNQLAELRSLVKDRAAANVKDDRGITALMVSAYAGSAEAMQLLLDRGADVNAKNAFDSTAVMWSVTDMQKVRMLVERGAEVNARSKPGRTAVMLAAMGNQSAEMVRFLVSENADLKAVDELKTTVLSAAAQGNDTETIRMLVDAGLDVNAPDFLGMTPFMYAAANGNTAAVKMMLAKGAKVNHVGAGKSLTVKNGLIDLGNFTALLLAAPFGPPELIQTLLDAGADVNAKDARGMTPLMLAVATDRADPRVVKMLAGRGADPSIKSAAGETTRDWAVKSNAAVLVKQFDANAVETVPLTPRTLEVRSDPKSAAEKSLALIEKTSQQFFVNGGCSACHAQNVADIVAATARTRGLRVDEKQTAERQKMNRAFFAPMVPNLLERIDPPGGIDLISYAMAGLAASGYAPDRMTDGIVADIASQQQRDGSWTFRLGARPPIEDGDFFRTALALRALKVYGTAGRRTEIAERIERAKSWLLTSQPLTAEDRNYQLLGARWAGSDEATLRRLSTAMIAHQRPDGGWSQRHELDSDAYATGQTLYALAESGFSTKDPVYEKGVRFLLGTQKDDGSWFVRSRAPKFQPYFESGFPYGHDQWISSMATGWAAAALAHAVDPVARRAAE
jgi:ankyrin repeat protein